ncbi:uncharacterized protein LOC120771577 [Bactrocera tryoni]|uniref:uncharacterized protein LOC120771577 n=1 Tax=Bactrocera tryoni TaxID=59916 RepID=UPI001A975777|nr:uncharacterized protein LOC120771577 [Bactrocera tryoni]
MIIRHMLESNNIFSAHLSWVYKAFEFVHLKNKSSVIFNTVICVFNDVKANLCVNNVLALNISGVNFCKNVNLSHNLDRKSLCIWSNCNVCSLSTVSKLNFIKMSLKSFSFTCDTVANCEVPAQSAIRVNIKSPFKQPAAQNLLAQLISGFSMPICKDMNKIPNNKPMETATRENERIPEDGSDKVKDSAFNTHPINLGCSYWKQRQRTLSEHSDDVYFLEDDASDTQNPEQYSTYYDDDDEEDSEDDECSSNISFGCNAEKLNDSVESLGSDAPKPAESSKRVRFNLNPEIHVMYAWSYAYRSARKGHWESLARDRDRFRKRIENTSKYINPILTPEHRSFIYNTRFDKNM